MPQYTASDEFITWAQSLSGMLTSIRTNFGSVGEMLESSEWNENRTLYALALVKSLHQHLNEIDKEFSRHVREKYGTQD